MTYKASPPLGALKHLGRIGVGCAAFILLSPLFLAFLILKIVLLPFERPTHRSAEEVACFLRGFVEGTGGEWDFDNLTSIPLADPRLESIRERAGAWLGDNDTAGWLALAEEAEAIATVDRQTLIGLLRRALAKGDVTGETIDDALPYPRSLGVREAKAYAALSCWADDDDIRAGDAAYAERQQQDLAVHLASLAAHPGQ